MIKSVLDCTKIGTLLGYILNRALSECDTNKLVAGMLEKFYKYESSDVVDTDMDGFSNATNPGRRLLSVRRRYRPERLQMPV